jgi:nicotinate-nucleotide adenylyltransferase
MRLGLFGGSFDPIHRGHVEPVLAARRELTLERVVYLPTAQPPHKSGRRFAPAAARFAMVELALIDEPHATVCDFELTPGVPAYTIDTIEHFARLFPRADLVLLLGEDSLAALPGWRRWRDIVERVEIGVLARRALDTEAALAALPGELRQARAAGRLRFVANDPIDVSSSELRRVLAAGGEPPAGAVPELVLKYLRKYPNLYA